MKSKNNYKKKGYFNFFLILNSLSLQSILKYNNTKLKHRYIFFAKNINKHI